MKLLVTEKRMKILDKEFVAVFESIKPTKTKQIKEAMAEAYDKIKDGKTTEEIFYLGSLFTFLIGKRAQDNLMMGLMTAMMGKKKAD